MYHVDCNSIFTVLLFFIRKKGKTYLQGNFDRRKSPLFSIIGSLLCLDMWCAYMLSSLWMVEIENTHTHWKCVAHVE